MYSRYIPYGFVLLLFFGAMCSPFLGMSPISPTQIWQWGHGDASIFWQLRLPRSLMAFWAGGGLAVCGLVFQTLLHNPLATPFTLGVSSGAALGASLYVFATATLPFLLPAGIFGAALAGSFVSVLIVAWCTRRSGHVHIAVMLLAGVIINFFFSSLVLFIQYISDAKDALRVLHWLMGSLAGVHTNSLFYIALVICVGSGIIYRHATELDLICLGEELAASRGVNVGHTQRWLFITTSVMVGCIVAITGPIGFVGMMVPHMCRLWLGYTHAVCLPWSFLVGGCFLTLCDAVSRICFAPAELPIGILTALLGGPFFLWILLKKNTRQYGS